MLICFITFLKKNLTNFVSHNEFFITKIWLYFKWCIYFYFYDKTLNHFGSKILPIKVQMDVWLNKGDYFWPSHPRTMQLIKFWMSLLVRISFVVVVVVVIARINIFFCCFVVVVVVDVIVVVVVARINLYYLLLMLLLLTLLLLWLWL